MSQSIGHTISHSVSQSHNQLFNQTNCFAGGSTNEGREEGTVLLNPNVYEARFLVPRRTTDPLPSRPELAGNTDTQVDAGTVCQNDEREALGQAAEHSIVLKNPKVEEASSMSLPRSENDFTKLSGAHEQEEESIGGHQHHVVQDDTDNSTVHLKCEGTGKDLQYQILLQNKRAHSAFICPSCNKNPDYQRLSMPQNCPHGTKDIPKQNRESIYQSLSGPEPGLRESVYAPITKESASEVRLSVKRQETFVLPPHFDCELFRTRPFCFLSQKVFQFSLSQARIFFKIFFLSKFGRHVSALNAESSGLGSSLSPQVYNWYWRI